MRLGEQGYTFITTNIEPFYLWPPIALFAIALISLCVKARQKLVPGSATKAPHQLDLISPPATENLSRSHTRHVRTEVGFKIPESPAREFQLDFLQVLLGTC